MANGKRKSEEEKMATVIARVFVDLGNLSPSGQRGAFYMAATILKERGYTTGEAYARNAAYYALLR